MLAEVDRLELVRRHIASFGGQVHQLATDHASTAGGDRKGLDEPAGGLVRNAHPICGPADRAHGQRHEHRPGQRGRRNPELDVEGRVPPPQHVVVHAREVIVHQRVGVHQLDRAGEQRSVGHVGETGRVGTPKRREIGHGRLAKRGILGVMPDMEEYPYTIRVVSEITESNGSSSMASVCGTSLALMDAGVAIETPVAGIAMGLIKEDDKFVVLSDILGDEDHLGDMDFKVAGTESGITALQMDIKIDGITKEIMEAALAQAKEGRIHILGEMNATISSHRDEMSEYAPRITVIKIHPDKIRDVIGKGGATIRAITEETGATINIDDDGTVKIAAVDKAAGEAALLRVEQITADIEVGKIYEGKVAKLMDFGAFVNILPGKDGLVHISQICEERVENVSDKLSEGDFVKVKVLEIDRQGRVRLSMKAVNEAEIQEA